MQLPIDLSVVSRPIRPKYLDEETRELARWFVFGSHAGPCGKFCDRVVFRCPDCPGTTVDICSSTDGNPEVFTRVPPDLAARLVAVRNTFADAIVTLLNEPGEPL